MNRSLRIAGTTVAVAAATLSAVGTIMLGPLASAAPPATPLDAGPASVTGLDTTGLDAGILRLSTNVATLQAEVESARTTTPTTPRATSAPSVDRPATAAGGTSRRAPAAHTVTGASPGGHGEHGEHGEHDNDDKKEHGHDSDD